MRLFLSKSRASSSDPWIQDKSYCVADHEDRKTTMQTSCKQRKQDFCIIRNAEVIEFSIHFLNATIQQKGVARIVLWTDDVVRRPTRRQIANRRRGEQSIWSLQSSLKKKKELKLFFHLTRNLSFPVADRKEWGKLYVQKHHNKANQGLAGRITGERTGKASSLSGRSSAGSSAAAHRPQPEAKIKSSSQ